MRYNIIVVDISHMSIYCPYTLIVIKYCYKYDAKRTKLGLGNNVIRIYQYKLCSCVLISFQFNLSSFYPLLGRLTDSFLSFNVSMETMFYRKLYKYCLDWPADISSLCAHFLFYYFRLGPDDDDDCDFAVILR